MADVDERLAIAMRLGLVEGRWDDALSEVRMTLVDHAYLPKALLALGVCYFHKRDFLQAITWLDQAERRVRRPTEGEMVEGLKPAIYLFRGAAYATRRLPNAARADFAELRAFGSAPIRWERFEAILRPDELARARHAAMAAGLPAE